MSIVNTETGEIITTDDVRQSVRRVIEHAESIWDEWAWQVENKTWGILGYSSWDEMRNGEYASLSSITAPRAERPELVSRFRGAGLTQRQTAETLGVSQQTVSNYDQPRQVHPPRPSTNSGTPATQTPAPADDREADAGAGLPTPACPTPSGRGIGQAGQDSSDVVAMGAPTSEGPTPPAAFEHRHSTPPEAPRPEDTPSPEVAEYLAGGSTDDLRFVQAFLRDSRTSLASYREHEDRIVDLVRRGVGVFGMGALDTTLQTSRSALEFLERINERANTTTLRRIK